jgi:formate--tetrahydrofolate ligase
MHGGVGKDDLTKENVRAVEQGLENLGKHLENLAKYGVKAVVAINQFTADTDAEMAVIQDYCQGFGVDAYVCSHWADGGAGAEGLAQKVAEIAESGASDFNTLYEDEMPLWDKMRTIAQEIYGADDISAERLVTERFKQLQEQGYGHLPICVAKTQYSFSTDPNRKGAPKGHTVSIREVRLAAGAEFLVVVCGDIMTMPGLPSRPAAEKIGLDENGQITGLF